MDGRQWVPGKIEHHKPLRSLASSPSAPQGLCFWCRDLGETIKELPMLDAAFIIESDGVIETCGGYIVTEIQEPRSTGEKPTLHRTHCPKPKKRNNTPS